MDANFLGGMDMMKSWMGNFAAAQPPLFGSMMTPTMDDAELEKRITDLRAVESWLEINANMLRATIQSLEVQRATLAALKNMSAAMGAPPEHKNSAAQDDTRKAGANVKPQANPQAKVQAKPQKAAHGAAPTATHAMGFDGQALWNNLQQQFGALAQNIINPPAAADSTKPATSIKPTQASKPAKSTAPSPRKRAAHTKADAKTPQKKSLKK